MLKKDFIDKVIFRMTNIVHQEQLKVLENALYIELQDIDLLKQEHELSTEVQDIDAEIVKKFFISKMVEGCSERTLQYYKYVLIAFFAKVSTPIQKISTDDIRLYIAKRAMQDKVSKCTQDNERRVLKSFFNWCLNEEYIPKDPTVKIQKVKQDRIIKKPFSEKEIEMLRESAKNLRDKAVIDVLYSTGVRVSELCSINIKDIENGKCVVRGKGGSERFVFFNAKATLSVEKYLSSRTDQNPALFVSSLKPNPRLEHGSIEAMLRRLGREIGIDKCHPHRFRRTAATVALNRGMPIEQVQKVLGHRMIGTTTIYAESFDENVEAAHRRYMSG